MLSENGPNVMYCTCFVLNLFVFVVIVLFFLSVHFFKRLKF